MGVRGKIREVKKNDRTKLKTKGILKRGKQLDRDKKKRRNRDCVLKRLENKERRKINNVI